MAASGGGSAAGFVVPGLPPPRAPRGARGGAVRCCRAPPPSAAAAAASRASAVAGAVLLGAAVGLLAVTPAGAAQLGDGQTIFEKSCAAYVVWAPPYLVLVSLVSASVGWLLSRSWPRTARFLLWSLVSLVWACSLTDCPRFGSFFWSGMSLICCCCLDRCHTGGGNIIGFSRGKTLKTAALSKYGYDTPDAIAGLVRSGKVRFALLSGRAARHTLPLCEDPCAWPPFVFPPYS